METTSPMEQIAEELMLLKTDHKEFKKANKELFLEHRQYNKCIKEKWTQLLEYLKEGNIDKYEFKGMEFEVKTTHREKHDIERLGEMISDESQLKDYIDDIRTSSEKIITRKAKKQRTDE
jgi:hypothetical protein